MIVSFQKAVPVLAAGLAGALLASCSQGAVCKELGNCGGSKDSLLGTWAQSKTSPNGGKYCQENMHIPPLQDYRQGQPVPVARQRAPENNNLDWCYNLVLAPTEMDPIKKHFYWWENLPYVGGLVTYNENGTYSIDFSREGKVHRYYSRTCLTQYGHNANCATFQAVLQAANDGAKEYDKFECSEDREKGGCNCSFLVGEANAAAGVYKVNGNVITHYSTSQQARFTEANFCVSGTKVELSGANNSFLWDRQGLRTIELVKVNCEDGVQGPGEEGVDCGLRCPMSCVVPEPQPEPQP